MAWSRGVNCLNPTPRPPPPKNKNYRNARFNPWKIAPKEISLSGGEGGAVLDIMHGRSRVAIDPRVLIYTMPGRIARRAFTDTADMCLH